MLLAFLSKRKQKKIVQVMSNLCLYDNKWQKSQQKKNYREHLSTKHVLPRAASKIEGQMISTTQTVFSCIKENIVLKKKQKCKMRISIGKCNLYETNHSYGCFFSKNLCATHGILVLPSNLFLEISTSNTMIGAQCTAGEIPFNLIISFTTKAPFLKNPFPSLML